MDTSDVERGAQRVKSSASEMGGGIRSSLGGILGIAASAATLVGVSLGMASIARNTVQVNSMVEQATVRYKTLTGSASEAQKRVESLVQFSRNTPFETQSVISAAEKLRLLGGAALDTNRNLQMFGDIAAATGQQLETVSNMMGRLYQSIQNGEPINRFAVRLERMGILTPQVTAKLLEMQKAHASAASIWDVVTKSAQRFNGAMEAEGNTWEGLQTRLHRTIADLEATAFKPFFTLAENGLRAIDNLLNSPGFARGAAAIASGITSAFQAIGNIIGPAMGAIGSALASVDWAGLGRDIGAGWQAMQPLFNGIRGAISGIGPALGRFADDLGAVRKQAAAGDWRQAGESLAKGFFGGIDTFLTAGDRLGQSIGRMMDKVDWWGEAQKAGPHILAFIFGVVIQLTDPMNWINLFMQHPIEIGAFFAAIFFAPERFMGPIIKILGRVPFVGPVLEWFLRSMRDIGQGLVRSAGTILSESFGQVVRVAMRGFERAIGRGAQDSIINVELFFDSLREKFGADSKLVALGTYELGRLILHVFWAGLRTLWPDIVAWAGGLVPHLGDAIKDGIKALGNFDDTAQKIGDALQKSIDKGKLTFQGIGAQAASDVGYGFGKALGDAVGGWFDALPGRLQTALSKLTKISPADLNFDSLGTAIGQALARAILGAGPGTGNMLRTLGTTLLPALLSGVQIGMPKIAIFFLSLPSTIAGYLLILPSLFISIGAGLLSGFISGLLSRWPAAQKWFQQLQSQIPLIIGNPIGWLITAGFNLINGFFNGITQRWGAVGAWLRGIKDTVLSNFGNPVGWLTNIGAQIFQGLLDGIQRKWQEIIGWIGGVAKSLPEPIRHALGLRSPSRVFTEMGVDTMAGYQIGLERGYGGVLASLSRFADNIGSAVGSITSPNNALTPTFAGVGAVGAGQSSSGDTYIYQTFNQADLQAPDVAAEMSWLMKTRRGGR